MFNALSGIGGGGQQDATTSNNGSVALVSRSFLMRQGGEVVGVVQIAGCTCCGGG